jgi:hypothetical protein
MKKSWMQAVKLMIIVMQQAIRLQLAATVKEKGLQSSLSIVVLK